MFALSLAAQPSLNLWDAPQPGQTSTWGFSDAAVGLPGGANQVWDIADANISFDYEVQFVDAASSPGYSNFPGAAVALVSTGGSVYVFLSADADGLQLMGNFDSDDGTGDLYSDRWKWLLYPTNYGTSWTDTMTFAPIGGGAAESHIHTNVADGHGTLVLPSGSVSGVLRTRMQNVETGNDGGVPWWDSTTYEFYWKPGFPLYLAYGYLNKYQSGSAPVDVSTDGEILMDISIGMEELMNNDLGLQVMLDATGETLGLLLVSEAPCTVELFDVHGRRITVGSTSGGVVQRADLRIAGLSPGIYVVHASNGRHHGTSKVVLSR